MRDSDAQAILEKLESMDVKIDKLDARADRNAQAIAEVKSTLGVVLRDLTEARGKLDYIANKLLEPTEVKEMKSGSSGQFPTVSAMAAKGPPR